VTSNGAAQRQITYSRVVDLQQPISPSSPLWPGDPAIKLDTVATLDNEGYFLRSLTIGEHSGTHLNAANSFLPDGKPIESYEPSQLVAKAAVMDLRAKVAGNDDYVISMADITDWERDHGRIEPGSIVIAYTGWQDRWSDAARFINADADGALHFPGFGAEAAAFLLKDRSVGGIGIDTHGLDPGLDEAFATNTGLAERNAIALENLGQLDQLPPTGTTIVIGILRLVGGSGSPVSVMAFVP
jgi:kynurenine formamidase